MAAEKPARAGEQTLAYLTLAPSALLLILLAAVPTVTVVLFALQSIEIGELAGTFVGFDNFLWVLRSRDFYNGLWNSFIWVFGSVFFEMLLGTAIALLLNQAFTGRGAVRALVLAPYLIPTVVAVLTWRFMFHDLLGIANYFLISIGLIDSPILWLSDRRYAMMAVIIVGVWKFLPFVVIAILGILQSIPNEQYEAAQIDGASTFQQFWRITLPYILPVFFLTALLRTIWTFNKFDIIYLLTGGGPLDSTTTVPILIYEKAFADFDMSRAAAIAVAAFLVLAVFLVAYLIAMKRSEQNQ
jgi:multiple sugar transport system permease protein